MSEPNWITEARKLIGLHEGIGDKDNPIVIKLFEDAGHPEVIHDLTPWCAAFIGAVLKRSGHQGNGSLWALSYATWGCKLDYVALGAVATKKRFNNAGKLVGGHVFFVVGWDNDYVYGLGGNQSDEVSINKFPRSVINRGFNSEVQLIFIELEGAAGVKFKPSNPTKDERANEEIQSADRRSTIPD